MTVTEFFDGINWDGKSISEMLPEISSDRIKEMVNQTKSFNVEGKVKPVYLAYKEHKWTEREFFMILIGALIQMGVMDERRESDGKYELLKKLIEDTCLQN